MSLYARRKFLGIMALAAPSFFTSSAKPVEQQDKSKAVNPFEMENEKLKAENDKLNDKMRSHIELSGYGLRNLLTKAYMAGNENTQEMAKEEVAQILSAFVKEIK